MVRPAVVPPAGRGWDRMRTPAGALGGRWGAFSESAEEGFVWLGYQSPTGGTPGRGTRPTGWPLRSGRLLEGGLEFFEAGCPSGSTEQGLERGFATERVDLLSYGVRHLAEPGVEDVDNRLAGGLEDAFFKAFHEAFLEALLEALLEAFLQSFLEGEFFEEGDVGHGCVG